MLQVAPGASAKTHAPRSRVSVDEWQGLISRGESFETTLLISNWDALVTEVVGSTSDSAVLGNIGSGVVAA